MPAIAPTVRARELGEELRRAREAAGFLASDLADMLDWSPSKISRMESGRRGVSVIDVAIYLTTCGVVGKELDRLLDLAAEQDDGYWLRPHGEQLPEQLRSLVVQENQATTITDFELARIPGLLQTEDYARALLTEVGMVPKNGIEPRVNARLARQSLLRRYNPPHAKFLIHENAARLMVGGRDVMQRQVRHLMTMAARPRCSVRVIPALVGPHAGLNGPFRLLEFTEHNPAVYLENQTSSLFLEKPQDIVTYRKVLGKLTDVALDEGQSLLWLAELASEYDDSEDGPDDGEPRGPDLA
ncbi:Helix-turn-helix domain-containing protein [Amycolatopsis arida]|uniref:Helix-turn-helix domain-containing protein n=1 Tax=Amycolatopsis arida TaxID=587909 RepID=A0A1I5LEZ1_9PSEU|nr:helix-turn-helix transcriptional regulator [Amycolatopsis arida]TDX93701.1 helix-turn-helix protein [Amycolatopsis arida]SFO95934.1 Helix-turn-helix domain-containing protein [Amycolatopsis arida]